MSNADELQELETRIAFQDQSIKELNDELYRQQLRITALEDSCRLLAAQLKAATELAGDAALGDDVPPHY